MTWHPDGTQIAGVVDFGEEKGKHVRVWNTLTGDIVNTYEGVDSYLYWSEIQWSPDGSVLVGTTSIPAILHAWDVETGTLLNEVDPLSRDMSAFFDMWWVNDGQQLITLSRYVSPPANSYLEIWDTETWKPQGRGFSLGEIRSIGSHPNEDLLALLTLDSQLMTWSLEQGETLQSSSNHGQPPQILSWSPDNQYLATARAFGETVYIWDTETPSAAPLQILMDRYYWLDVEALSWHMDSSILRGVLKHSQFTAPGTQLTGFVVEWDAHTGESLGAIHETGGHIAHDGSGSYLPFSIWSADFTRVAIVLRDEPITTWEVETGHNGRLTLGDTTSTMDVEHYSAEVIWSPDNTMLAIISRDPQGETSAWVYDAETGDLINRLRPTFFTNLYNISWSPDSSMVALVGSRGIAGSDETEYRLDVAAIEPSSPEARHVTTVLDTGTRFYHAWHPESHTIVVSTSSGVEVYPIEPAPIGINAESVAIIPDMPVRALAWSPNGMWLAGSHEDGTVRIWAMTQATG